MSTLPDEIEIRRTFNNGFSEDKSDRELVRELIEGFNELRNYIKEVLEPLS